MKSIATAALLGLALAAPVQAENLYALSFTGTVAVGADNSGNVFGNTVQSLVGKAASGSFVFDVDKIVPTVAFAATHADYDNPLHPAGAPYGAASPAFLRAFITVDGRTHEIESAPQPGLDAPMRHSLSFDDVPGNPAADSVSASLTSFRPQICACVTAEFLQLSVTGLAVDMLNGESFAQAFSAPVQSTNLSSFVQFQVLSGFQYGSVYVPSLPQWAVESFHYAVGTITLGSLSLQHVSAVPEPAPALLLSGGLAAVLLWRRRVASR